MTVVATRGTGSVHASDRKLGSFAFHVARPTPDATRIASWSSSRNTEDMKAAPVQPARKNSFERPKAKLLNVFVVKLGPLAHARESCAFVGAAPATRPRLAILIVRDSIARGDGLEDAPEESAHP